MVIDISDTETIINPINVRSLVASAIAINERSIVDLNRQQLYAGNTANENEIKPKYKPFTIQIKQEKGQPFDRVTLNDTGDFYNSIFLNPFGSEFEFDATDIKKADLEEKYGSDILGITPGDLDDAAEIIKDTLIELFTYELRK